MMSKLSHQAILKGYVDYYCLVCEKHITNEMGLYGHVLSPAHKGKENAVGYMDKYKDNQIRKVKYGYFCEFCNELFPTTAKVGIHLDNPLHINKKGALLLKRVGGNVTFENTYISDMAWNGLMDDTCMLCNTEFENAEIHKSESSHKLNLVQCKTDFGTGGIIYRKVDDNSFHCLPCNKIFSTTVFETHFNTETHKQTCSKITPNVAAVPVNNQRKSENRGIDVKENEKPKTLKDASKKPPLRSPSTRVDIEKPFPDRIVSNEYESLVCTLLKANSYIVQHDDGTIHCILCEKQMPAILSEMHLKELDHKYLLKLHKKRLEKYAQNQQIEVESKMLDAFTRFQNNSIDIDITEGTAKCKLCLKLLDFVPDLIDEHINHHKESINKEREVTEAAAKLNDEKELAANNAATNIKPKPVKKLRTRSRSNSSSSMTEAEKEEWAIEHNITFNRFQNMAYCNICDSKLPMSINNLKQHVTGSAHRNLLAKSLTKDTSKSNSKPKLLKVPTKAFVKSFQLVENFVFQYFIINKKFVISYKSMSFLWKTNAGFLRCFLCGDDLADIPFAIEVHRTTPKHSLALESAAVIASLDSEFVRETTSGEFHCGYCNQTAKDWDDLQNHFATVEHKESRSVAEWRLIQFTRN